MNSSAPIRKKTSLGERPRAAVSFFCGICLLGLTALFYFGGNESFLHSLSIIPALLALLLFYNGIHSLLASKTPPTEIILSKEPLVRGTTTEIKIHQGGPAVFVWLRASLVCERIEYRMRQRLVTYPFQENFFDSGRFEVGRLDKQEFQAHVTMPANAEPSQDSGNVRIFWRLEIWGKVEGRADFMRPFDVEVV